MKPWLLIDVDGVLNVSPSQHRPDGAWTEHVVEDRNGIPYRLHLNQIHGEWLDGLTDAFALVWCTTWTRIASATIGPLIGLPAGLPYVPLGDPRYSDHQVGVCWKTPLVHFWLEGRSAAWIDDDITTRDSDGLVTPAGPEGIRSPAALALQIDPNVGLLTEHVETLRAWAGDLA